MLWIAKNSIGFIFSLTLLEVYLLPLKAYDSHKQKRDCAELADLIK